MLIHCDDISDRLIAFPGPSGYGYVWVWEWFGVRGRLIARPRVLSVPYPAQGGEFKANQQNAILLLVLAGNV